MKIKIYDIFTPDDIKKYSIRNLKVNTDAIYNIDDKTLNVKKFSNNKYYRIVCVEYLKFLGFTFVATQIVDMLDDAFYEDKKIDIVATNKVINLLQDAGICNKTSVKVTSSLDEMQNINYNLYEGIEKEFSIKFEFKQGTFLYKGIINNIDILEESVEKTSTSLEIKFKLKIQEEEKYNIYDKVCIKTEEKDYIFEFNCVCEEVRNVSEEYKWVYDFIDSKIISDEFEKRAEEDFKNILILLKDYKNASIYDEAIKFAKTYKLDWKEIFEVIKNNNVNLENNFREKLIDNDKFLSMKKDLLAIKKSLFFSKEKRGFAGIEKYITYFMNEGVNNNALMIDSRYKKLKLKLIGYLKNDISIYDEDIFKIGINVKREKKFGVNNIFTKNPYYFLQNIKIPNEFYFYVFENINEFQSDEVKNFIKRKLINILKQEIVFTLPKTELLKFVDRLFESNDEEYKIIKYKINELVSFNYENKKELVILNNDFLESSFIIEICDSKNIENYIVKIDGTNTFLDMNNTKCYEMDNDFNFNLKKLKEIISTRTLNYENSFTRICKFNMFYNYYKKNKKIDEYIETLFIKNRGDFSKIYSLIKKSEVNKTQIELFKENIDNKSFVKDFIINENDEEKLFDILNFVGYKNLSLYIRTLFLLKFYDLGTRKLKITELCERMIADKPFIIKKVKRLLERQYDEGLFTDESSKIIDLLKYSEQGLEKYIIKLKTRNREFDTEFVQIIRELYEKDKLDINLKQSLYILAANRKISGLDDIVFEMNKDFEDVILTNYMITRNNEYKKIFLDKNDKKLVGNIIRLYNDKEALSVTEKNIGFEIIEKVDYLGDESEAVSFLEKNYETGRLQREEIKKVRVYFTKARKLMHLYLKELSEEFMKDNFMSKAILDYKIDAEDTKYIRNGITSGMFLSRDDKFLAYIILIKKYIIEKNEESLSKSIDDAICDSSINLILLIEKIAYQDISKAITIFCNIYTKKNKNIDISKISELDLKRMLGVLINRIKYFKSYLEAFNILEVLNKINFYDEKIFEELLILCLYKNDIDYVKYNYIINVSLKKLNEKANVLKHLSSRSDLPGNIYYEHFNGQEDFDKKINDYYLNANIDDIHLKEIAMREYFYNDEKFINILNRKGINDSIKSLIKNKIQEKFKEDIYYCEKLVNSYYIYNDKTFDTLRWHVNNYFENMYTDSAYIKNYFIKKNVETSMCERLCVIDIFSNDTKVIYKFKNDNLKNKILSYMRNKSKIELIETGMQSFNLSLQNSKLTEISSLDLLRAIKEFILFLLELDKFNIAISAKSKLCIVNNHIFIFNICDFVENKKYNNQIFKSVFKSFVKEYNLSTKEFKKIQIAIQNSTSCESMLVELKEFLFDMENDLETLPMNTKLERFDRYSKKEQKYIINEIINKNSSSSMARKRLVSNLNLVENNEKTLDYLITMFIETTTLAAEEYKKIYEHINKFDKSSIDTYRLDTVEALVEKRFNIDN